MTLAACSPSPDLETVSVPDAPASPTEPGATLAIGETAWIAQEGAGGEELIGTTVREISELDPADIEGYADDPELAAFNPYAVVVQFDWEPVSEFDSQTREVPVLPITADGELAQWLANDMGNVAMGDADACGMRLPEPTAGSALTCFVALGSGADVVGAEYNGTSRDDFAVDEEHPFAGAPITWRG